MLCQIRNCRGRKTTAKDRSEGVGYGDSGQAKRGRYQRGRGWQLRVCVGRSPLQRNYLQWLEPARDSADPMPPVARVPDTQHGMAGTETAHEVSHESAAIAGWFQGCTLLGTSVHRPSDFSDYLMVACIGRLQQSSLSCRKRSSGGVDIV